MPQPHDVTMRELDPTTGCEETRFHAQVRDVLGLSPFERHDALYAELRRLKACEERCKKLDALFAEHQAQHG